MRITTLMLMTLAIVAGCQSASFEADRTETTLPVSAAWVDGNKVEYVTTDVSDSAMAEMLGVNYVPRLANVIPEPGGPSALARVYVFPGGEQISIFQVAPQPAGPTNTDRHYSPLWRVVMVRWLRQERVRELKSEGALFTAERNGDVSIEVTGVIANCPVTRSADGRALRGVR